MFCNVDGLLSTVCRGMFIHMHATINILMSRCSACKSSRL